MSDNCENGVMGILKKLAPGTPVGGVYLKGQMVEVTSFSNLSGDLAYFVGAECGVCVFDATHINGLCFLPTEAEEA